jgi:hypothetical protein
MNATVNPWNERLNKSDIEQGSERVHELEKESFRNQSIFVLSICMNMLYLNVEQRMVRRDELTSPVIFLVIQVNCVLSINGITGLYLNSQ